MSESVFEQQGEESLKKEKEILKQILIKRLSHEDDSEWMRELEAQANVTNQLLLSFLETREDAEIGTQWSKAVDACRNWLAYSVRKSNLEENYSIEGDLSHRSQSINYAYHNFITNELVRRLLWYYDREEAKPDPEEMAEDYLSVETDTFTLRNFFLGKEVKAEIAPEGILLPPDRELLKALIQMDATHHIFKCNIKMIIAFCDQLDIEKITPALFLNLALAISMQMDLIKAYGLEMEEDTPFVKIVEEVKESALKLPGIEEHPEVICEIEHIFDNANALSEKYKHRNEK